MSNDHDRVTAPRKRKLEHHGAAADSAVLADEEMARRLHEELNAGMTRRRGSSGAVLKFLDFPLEHRASRSEAKSSREAGVKSNSSTRQDQAAAKIHLSASAIEQQDTPANLRSSQVNEPGKSSALPSRKRTLLSRELAMLVTDMVEAQLRPAKTNRHQPSPLPRQRRQKDDSSSNEEEDVDHAEAHAPQKSQQAGAPATKPETSSCHSEQDRVIEEHMPSMGTQTELPKAQSAPAASCNTDEHSSGTGRSSSSSREHQKSAEIDAEGVSERQRSAAPGQVKEKLQMDGSGTAAIAEENGGPASASAAAAAERKHAGKAPRSAKIPKLPMVQYGKKWYRAKVLKDVPGKVLVEFQGYSHEGGPFWLAKESHRLWKGSYKGRDWKYLGEGAWEPRPRRPKGRCGRGARSSAGKGCQPVASSSTGGGAVDHGSSKHIRGAAAGEGGMTATSSNPEESSSDEEELEEGERGLEAMALDEPSSGVAAAREVEVKEEVIKEERHAEQEAETRIRDCDMTEAVADPADKSAAAVEEGAGGSGTEQLGDIVNAKIPAASSAAAEEEPAVAQQETASSPLVPGLKIRTTRSSRLASTGVAAAVAAAAAAGEGGEERGAPTSHPTGKRSMRAPRSRHVLPVIKVDSGGEQQQDKASAGEQLQQGPARSFKHSSSSNGLGSPRSPFGTSPKAHRRKGIPQRARMDSEDLLHPVQKPSSSKSSKSSGSSGGGSGAVARTASGVAEACGQQLGWKGAWKGAYKKAILHAAAQEEGSGQEGLSEPAAIRPQPSHQQQPQEQQEELQKQQDGTEAAPVQEEKLMATTVAAAEPANDDDLVAAAELVANLGGSGRNGSLAFSCEEAEGMMVVRGAGLDGGQGMPISPRSRPGTRRRGHNWSKPLRPPRGPGATSGAPSSHHNVQYIVHQPPSSMARERDHYHHQLQQQQHPAHLSAPLFAGGAGPGVDSYRRHSVNGCSLSRSGSLEASSGLGRLGGAGWDAAGATGGLGCIEERGGLGRRYSLEGAAHCAFVNNHLQQGLVLKRQSTLNTLLDAVGQMQLGLARSGSQEVMGAAAAAAAASMMRQGSLPGFAGLQLGVVEHGFSEEPVKRGIVQQQQQLVNGQQVVGRQGVQGLNGRGGGSAHHHHHVVALRLGRPGSSGSSSGGESERVGSAGPAGAGRSSLLLARLPSYDAVKRLAQLHAASQEMPLFR